MAQNEKMSAVLDLRGLDMVTPVDLLSNGRTPYSKNFRLYAQQTDDRRVAVSSRKGPGFHTAPIAETLSGSVQGSVGASSTEVGIITGQHAIPLTASSNDRITRIDVKVGNNAGGSGPLMVQIYSDKNNMPSDLLTESAILGGDIPSTPNWCTARFVKAIKMVSGTKYWIVLRMQDDGVNTYQLATTTDGTFAHKTDSTLSQIQQQTYAVNYRVYTAVDGADKGAYRFTRDNGVNITLVAYGTTMYRIDEATNSLVKLIDGLSPLAQNYSFTNGDNKAFWVNSYDQLTAWDGKTEEANSNLVNNGSFTTNTSGWTLQSGSTITRSTADFYSTPASLQVTATSGTRGVYFTTTNLMLKNNRYRVSFWAKGVTATGNMQITVNDANPPIQVAGALTTGWTKYEFYYTPTVDVNQLYIQSTASNFFLDDVSVKHTGIEYIIDAQLPILSQVLFHKDRVWGVDANDPNKIVFSENPGNPAYDPTGAIPTTARQQWYYEWLSVSYWYVPRPHNGSPITALVSFQDSLTVFTQDNKYVLSGSDRGSLYLRQSTGSKGALSRRGVTNDENNIFFVGSDGLYSFNGSEDTKVSSLINPLFDACGQKEMISPVIWKNEVRFYMASQGSPVNDLCVIYNKDLEELLLDTDTYVNRAIPYLDADDNGELIEFSSLVPVTYLAEQNYHSLGAPIDFEYRLKYDSMGTPAQRKRLKRFYPILQGVDSSFNIQLMMDKDFEDSPRIKDYFMATKGAKWGEFKWGDGTVLGGDKSFKLKRQSYSGYANYWQLRVARKGVNNRVAFIGAQFSYKTKRL